MNLKELRVFGFSPKAPVSEVSRAWIETSMQRFVGMFGEGTLHQVQVVLPLRESFPGACEKANGDEEVLLQRVCEYMQVDRQRIELKLFHEIDDGMRHLLPHWHEAKSGAAGLYHRDEKSEKIIVVLKVGHNSNGTSIIATIAHELGHVLLLADGRIERSDEDMELLTDLVTIFFGMGLFTANAALRFSQFDDGARHGWSSSRQGYMSEPMLGYALAFYAAMRDEERPSWAKHIKNDSIYFYFKQSQKFIAHERKKNHAH